MYPDRDTAMIEQLKAESKVVAADGSEEFSGDRAGATTYRCICPHDKTPLVTTCCARGADTLRCLAYIKLVMAFLKGIIPTLPPERPGGLPGNFARFAQIATTETNALGETVTVMRTVAFEYALQQKLNAFFGRESHPPPGRNQPLERSG